MLASVFFSRKKACQTESFYPRIVKNGQHLHKDRPHIQEKSQGAATSVEDAVIILRCLNLCGVHCIYELYHPCLQILQAQKKEIILCTCGP
jgi:hypothetical protein